MKKLKAQAQKQSMVAQKFGAWLGKRASEDLELPKALPAHPQSECLLNILSFLLGQASSHGQYQCLGAR